MAKWALCLSHHWETLISSSLGMKGQSCWTVVHVTNIPCVSHHCTGKRLTYHSVLPLWAKQSSEQWWKRQIAVESMDQEKHSRPQQITGTYQVDPDTPHRYMTASKKFCFFSSTKVPSRATMARRPPPDPRTTILGTSFWGMEDKKTHFF